MLSCLSDCYYDMLMDLKFKKKWLPMYGGCCWVRLGWTNDNDEDVVVIVASAVDDSQKWTGLEVQSLQGVANARAPKVSSSSGAALQHIERRPGSGSVAGDDFNVEICG